MQPIYHSGSFHPSYGVTPKFAVGDIVYNKHAKEHYLIEGIEDGVFGTYYHFRVLETDSIDTDICERADKSRNLIKVA